MHPYFSVLIPTRTVSSQLIKETLPALQAQIFTQFEVIVTPDKKSSFDRELMEKYAWLKILYPKNIHRPGDKRDSSAQQAKGTILVFLDDDAYPTPKWLKNAHTIFSKDKIAALGGPGILPLNPPFWERVFDAMLRTWVGSGSYTYRFTPQARRYVDDYPSMNLMIRRDVFERIGGFGNQHWPGEDSKLLHKFITHENQFILYDPSVVVFHHRRDSLLGHLIQHKNYGVTRGTFAAQGDTNSTHIMYIIPALFTLYLFALLIMWSTGLNNSLLHGLSGGLYFYLVLLGYVFFASFLFTENVLIAFLAAVTVPITHLVYGMWFIKGYVYELLGRLLKRK